MSESRPLNAGLAGTIDVGGDLTVNRLGFGAMRITGHGIWGPPPDRDVAKAVVRRAVELGVNFIDTADSYGPHVSEEILAEALHPYPEELVIATKGGFVRGGYDYSTLDAVGNPNYLRQSAHMSARRLGVDSIDLYYLHSGQATDVPFEDQIATLAALKEEGLIRHIGLSNVTLEQFELAQTITAIAAVTALHNTSIRRGLDLLRATEKSGAVFSPWHPMGVSEGGDPDRIIAALEPIAQSHDATVQQIALAWHLHLAPHTLPIPGTTSLEHLRTNLAAAQIQLTHDEVAAITALV